MKKILLLTTILLLQLFDIQAQEADSLMLEFEKSKEPETTIASFKSSRLILSQTTKMVKKQNLDFKVIHRFGDIGGNDGGSKTLWGFDNSSDIYIGFEYGITDKLNIEIGRSKFEQLLGLQFKYALLQQKVDNKMPVSIGIIAKLGFTPYKVTTTIFDDYGNRFSYLGQAIISRKFSSNLSLQVSPTVLHRNQSTISSEDEATLFALGTAGRYKFAKRLSFIADYYWISSDFRNDNPNINYHSPLGLGVEIETGGHVFTLNFANSKAIAENNFIANTTSSWRKGEYRFGFTISRVFDFNKSNQEPKS